MSEFQIYQFKSIDRPLTDAERKEIGTWSTRTNPTSNSATYTYAYGDFPKDEEKAVEQYFDAMLYAANWGTKRLIFRLPKNLVDPEALSAYLFEDEASMDTITLKECTSCYLLGIHFSNEEGGTWLSEDDYTLDDLVPLRDNIIEGDYRALYLVWLQFAQYATHEEDEEEDITEHVPPPVPPNLSKLNAPLKAFIEFFEIDEDMVAAVEAASPVQETAALDHETLIAQLPEKERNEWLLRLANGEPRLEITFKKHLRQLIPSKKTTPSASPSLADINTLIRTKTNERLERESEAARLVHIQKMDQLAREESALWKSVDENLLKATSKSYDQAIATLKDMRDLAIYQDKEAGFKTKIDTLKVLFARKSALIKRLREAKL